MNKQMKQWAETHTDVINIFLKEYMEVNGIEEKMLKEHLVIVQTPEGVLVKEGNHTLLNIQWGKMKKIGEEYSIVLTILLTEEEKYPKTNQFIQEISDDKTIYSRGN